MSRDASELEDAYLERLGTRQREVESREKPVVGVNAFRTEREKETPGGVHRDPPDRASGSLVDVSPLSTLGALCVAAVPDGPEARALFRRLLMWGLSMAVVGAILCQVLAGPLARVGR